MADHPVVLRIYDMSRGMAKAMSMAVIGRQVDGIWHTGLSVYGREYFFGQAARFDQSGLQSATPQEAAASFGMVPTELVLGTTAIPEDLFEDFLREVGPQFTGQTYNVLNHNCNHFTQAAAEFLTGSGIPDHIVNQAQIALAGPRGRQIAQMFGLGDISADQAAAGGSIQGPEAAIDADGNPVSASSGGSDGGGDAALTDDILAQALGDIMGGEDGATGDADEAKTAAAEAEVAAAAVADAEAKEDMMDVVPDEPIEGGMKVLIKLQDATKADMPLFLGPSPTVGELQEKITAKTGIDAQFQRLIFAGRILKTPTDTLEAVKVKDGNVVHLLDRTPAGGAGGASAGAGGAAAARAAAGASGASGASGGARAAVAAVPAAAVMGAAGGGGSGGSGGQGLQGTPLGAALARIRVAHAVRPAAAQTTLSTLSKVCGNIIDHPTEEKYRSIKRANKVFVNKIGGVDGGTACMEAVGFTSSTLESGEGAMVLEASAEAWPKLVEGRKAVDALLAELKSAASSAPAAPAMGGMRGGGMGGGLGGGMPAGMGEMAQQMQQQMQQNPAMAQQVCTVVLRCAGGMSGVRVWKVLKSARACVCVCVCVTWHMFWSTRGGRWGGDRLVRE